MVTVDAAPQPRSPSAALPTDGRFAAEENEAERQLSADIAQALAKLSSASQTLAGGHARDGASSAGHSVDQLSLQPGGSAAGMAALSADLAQVRALLHRVDSERRHYRQLSSSLRREVQTSQRELHDACKDAADSHRQTHGLEAQAAAAKETARSAEDALDQLTEETMRLRRFIRALPPPFASGFVRMEEQPGEAEEVVSALALVPDRRFQEAFTDKMASIEYRRRFRCAKALHQETAARLEALSMEREDRMQQVPPLGLRRESLEGSEEEAAPTGSSGQPSGAAAASLLLSRGILDFPFQLPFQSATPKDGYIKSLIYHSQFAEPLNQGRDGLLRLSTRLKTTLDGGLRALYAVQLDSLRTARTGGCADATSSYHKRTFETQLKKLQTAHRELLFTLVSLTNTMTTDVVELERGRRGGEAGSVPRRTGRQTRDVGCMAVDTSRDDRRVHDVEERLAQLRLRSLEVEAACTKKLEAAGSQRAAARQDTCEALASLSTLGKAVVAAARLTQRRRGGGEAAAASSPDSAASAVTDPFERVGLPLTSDDALDDPRLLAKVAEATETAVAYLRQASMGWGVGPTAEPQFPLLARISQSAGESANLEVNDLPAVCANARTPVPPPLTNAAAEDDGKARRRSDGSKKRRSSLAQSAPARPVATRELKAPAPQPARADALPSVARRTSNQPSTPNAINARGARERAGKTTFAVSSGLAESGSAAEKSAIAFIRPQFHHGSS